MNLQIGNRVICNRNYQNGVRIGEKGVILDIRVDDFAKVRWDNYYDVRHSCGGMCERGHGWNVPLSYITRDIPDDLGDFIQEANLDILFGGATLYGG